MGLEFSTAEEFCGLFGIDTQRGGAADFCRIVSTAAALRFYYLPGGVVDAVTEIMRERRISPRLFFSNVRRAMAPALGAGRDTLAALGVIVRGEGDHITVYELAGALAGALAREGYVTIDRVRAGEIATTITQGRGGK